MRVDYKELADRLELSCMKAHQKMFSKQYATSEEFEAEVEKSFNKITDIFVKRHEITDDENALEHVHSVISLYKKKCLTDFKERNKCA